LLFIWLNNVGSGKVNAGLVGFLGYYGLSGQINNKGITGYPCKQLVLQ